MKNSILIQHTLTRFLATALTISLLAMTAHPIAANKLRAKPPTPPVSGPRPGLDKNWLAKVEENIRNSEYEIRWQSKVNAFQAPNRAQNLRFTFFPTGFEAEPRQSDLHSQWKLKLALLGLSKSDEINILKPGQLTVDENTARAASPGVEIEYVNDNNGMRQNFIVLHKPQGEAKLKLHFALSGEQISMNVRAEENSVVFGRAVPGGARLMQYADVKVWDSKGRSLKAQFEAVSERQFALAVDDRAASYPITVDPLSTSLTWTGEGNQTSAYYGTSVASAGDVNGDGYSDIIVGAHYFDNGQTDEGRAYVYHGSASGPSASADWTAESDEAFANFGVSVASAGDVNGDGYSDIIVGAQNYDNSKGAFVWFGSSTGLGSAGTPSNADWSGQSGDADSSYGQSVACAGDVNGDGYSDIIVGAPGFGSGSDQYGKVFVHHGSSTGPASSASWTATGDTIMARLGQGVASAGDTDGDGYSDIVVGSLLPQSGGKSTFIWNGSSTGLGSDGTPSNADKAVGTYQIDSVASAGDINGDGYSDVIVGGYTSGSFQYGKVFVYHGSSTGISGTADWTAETSQTYDSSGSAVASAGDVNGDGYADVIIGAAGYDNGNTDEGAAFVYYGSSSGLGANGTPGNADWVTEGSQNSAALGSSVGTAGDVNGDGFSDVIIGAYTFANGHTSEGAAFVYSGSAAGIASTVAWNTEGNDEDAQYGLSVATAGDVNGDGYSDVIVGAPFYTNGQTDEGRVFVFHGSAAGLSTTANWTAESDQASSSFGFSVAAAGDVNGDGYGDVIVGAPLFNVDLSNEGRAFVWLGSSSGLGANGTVANADWKAQGNQVDAQLGSSVASAGDVDGNGYSDVIVAAVFRNNGQTDEGQVFVWHGSSSDLGADGTPGNADWTAESDQASSQFGVSVASAGDVNGDGYGDIIVGANFYDDDADQSNEGAAFVWLGSSTGLGANGTPSNADWKMESNQTDGDVGWSVSSAGDVNGDGYSDIIIGAPSFNVTQTDEGAVFVYLGGSSDLGDNGTPDNADWTFASGQSTAYAGVSVSTAGDVNGDGYSDVIIGARAYDSGAGGASDDGLVITYLGSSSGLLTSSYDALYVGGQTGANLGISVAGAGDVNGDGYSDVLMGADLFDNPTTDEGGAFLSYGNGGDGADVKPRQWRSDLTTPVVAPLRTASTSQAGVGLTGRTFHGRGDVKVQYEVKALGTAFNGSSLTETASWTDTGTGGSAINQTISSLSNNTFYKWRARIKYRLSEGAVQPFSRWFYIPANGPTESDFQVRN